MTNTSVNPARSTATALFVGGVGHSAAVAFWLAPVVGAALAGVTYQAVFEAEEEPPVTGRPQASKHQCFVPGALVPGA